MKKTSEIDDGETEKQIEDWLSRDDLAWIEPDGTIKAEVLHLRSISKSWRLQLYSQEPNVTKRELILAVAHELGVDFARRKDDEELTTEDLQEAIEDGEPTWEEILAAFRKGADL